VNPIVLPAPAELTTERLLLRPWREADREPLAALHADPEVMAFFPSTLSRAQSDANLNSMQAQVEANGWGLWAAEALASRRFIGLVGLAVPQPALPFCPCVEVAWRLARSAWGQGYATEAARAALRFGFEVLQLPEIVSFTVLGNQRSRAVMERIGLTNTNADFDHPGVPEGRPLRRHCLYRIAREQRKNLSADLL
jgi:RimJ/RimL family protein N-acetyltransferase